MYSHNVPSFLFPFLLLLLTPTLSVATQRKASHLSHPSSFGFVHVHLVHSRYSAVLICSSLASFRTILCTRLIVVIFFFYLMSSASSLPSLLYLSVVVLPMLHRYESQISFALKYRRSLYFPNMSSFIYFQTQLMRCLTLRFFLLLLSPATPATSSPSSSCS